MSTASGLPIDQALEKIAEFLADGRLESAAALLPEIIANGDEVQQQMGVLYQEQLDLLRAEADEHLPETDSEEAIGIPSKAASLDASNTNDTQETPLTTKTTPQKIANISPSLSQHIDHKLEEVAQLFADEQLDAIAAILPTIIENGSEAQKQMGEAYLEQLKLLRSMEESHTAVPSSSTEAPAGTGKHDEIRIPEQGTAANTQANSDNTPPTTDNLQQATVQPAQVTTVENTRIHINENDSLAEKKRSLGEAVMERALSLIGKDNEKAIKLLYRIAEADHSEQQSQALYYLAALGENIDDNKQTTSSAGKIHTEDNGNIPASVHSAADMDEEPQLAQPLTTPTQQTADHQQNDTNDSLSEYSATVIDEEPQLAQPLTTTPVQQTADQSATHNTTDGSDQEDLQQESTEGLSRPGEVLQADYGTDMMPMWDGLDTNQMLQHGHVGHYRQGFYIGDVAVMIDFADGSELMGMPKTYVVPNGPQWLIGLTNVHSRIIPVFDLASFFGLSDTKKLKKMMLVLGHDDNAIGIVISGIPTRIQWNESQQVDPNTAPLSLRNCIHAAYLLSEQLWFDLDCDALTTNLKTAMQAR